MKEQIKLNIDLKNTRPVTLDENHVFVEGVILRNRVLGGLMPTRAFGDSRYKWSRDIQDKLNSHGLLRKSTPIHLLTPPYVIAEPIVTFHKLQKGDKYLVMATDGLYDEISNEQVMHCIQTSDKNDNLATNLIRIALGDGNSKNYQRISKLLTIPPPETRKHRDDMTIFVARIGDFTKSKTKEFLPRKVDPVIPKIEYKLENLLKSLVIK
jgi:pyruvate dehydrogenase phosphatase